MDNVRLTYSNRVNAGGAITNCVSFVMEREVYTPYVKLGGVFICNGGIDVEQIKTIGFYINGVQVFMGIPDNLVIKNNNGVYSLVVSARSYTSLLGQNQPQPGLYPSVNLSMLISNNLSSSDITCQQSTPSVNYIFVKNNSTLWEAVVMYAMKAVTRYPFIYGNNQIMISPMYAQSHDYSLAKITETGRGVYTTNMLSTVYMKNSDDEYAFTGTSTKAQSYGIIRSKYYDLDRQWLDNEQKGLNHKIGYSERQYLYSYFTYMGYSNEQLYDTVSLSGSDFNYKRLSRIRVSGDKNGIKTKLWCYLDSYAQK